MDYVTLSESEWDRVERVRDLLERGDVETARREIDALQWKRPGHPDLRVVDAMVSLEEGEAQRAWEALQGAERSADPALFFHLRAAVHFDLARFEEARDDAERALAIHDGLAETHDLLSRILEHLGDVRRAREHAAEAQAIDPDSFPLPLEITDEEFDALVAESLRELPHEVSRHLDELPVMVEPLPRRELLTAERPVLSPDLLGLFVGRHLLEVSVTDTGTIPGAIYLFRRNLLRVCSDRQELAREIRTTVRHEVGHLLGLDEDDLEQWGLA